MPDFIEQTLTYPKPRRGMIALICPVCRRDYLANTARLKFRRQTTCSRSCSYAFRACAKRRLVAFACPVCKKNFERTRSKIKRNKHGGPFCSVRFHFVARRLGLSTRVVTRRYRMTETGRIALRRGSLRTSLIRKRNHGYRKTDDMRAKNSIATAFFLASHPAHITSEIENVVAKELDALGAVYVRQHVFRDHFGRFAALADFWFPERRTVIEVNGTYWHADPRVYSTGLNAMQSRAMQKYARKLDLYKRLGIPIVEVWEADIRRSSADAVRTGYAAVTSVRIIP